MNAQIVDINCDVGEGIGNETRLMPYIGSCNIACGGHAGDSSTMQEVVRLAKKHAVKIGAHPSFPDKENFGRQTLEMSSAALFKSLKHQINTLFDVIRDEHAQLHHIKPHGALYNLAAVDDKTATVILEVMKGFHESLKLYVPYKSVIAKLALKANIPIMYEAFADRNYNDNLTLVSRQNSKAIITDPEAVFRHVKRMILNQKVQTLNGVEVQLKAETFCIHGDNPNAVELIIYLTDKLIKNNIVIT